MNSLEVLLDVLRRNSKISRVRLFEFQRSPKLQDRLGALTSQERILIDAAIRKKESCHLPFWEALLSVVSEAGQYTPRLLCAALLHQTNNAVADVRVNEVQSFVSARTEVDVACNSQVLLEDGSSAHIPLLDFNAPVTKANVSLVAEVVRQMGLKGYVLNSGRSFHFWGYQLLSQQELVEVLGRFVLLHPVADKSWAAHQLIEGSASLRVSPRHGQWPRVLVEVH